MRASHGPRRVALGGTTAILWLAATLATAQELPRTPDGHPDIQGVWVNFNRTPLEVWSPEDIPRLDALKKWYTNLEVTAEGYRFGTNELAAPGLGRLLGDGNNARSTQRSELQRSLVVDPPNGRVPVRPEAEQQKSDNVLHMTDSYDTHNPYERCITRGVPGGMMPISVNSAYRFLQTPGYVVIVYEMIHEARIIPLDGREPVAEGIRLWNGDSRGRWEGNTLVVEVDRYRSEQVGTVVSGVFTNATLKGIPQSSRMRVVERFTVVGPGEIRYEATIDDPGIYTAPWTVSLPLSKDDGYQMYEFACHEGNYGMTNSLSGSRAEERAAGAKQ